MSCFNWLRKWRSRQPGKTSGPGCSFSLKCSRIMFRLHGRTGKNRYKSFLFTMFQVNV